MGGLAIVSIGLSLRQDSIVALGVLLLAITAFRLPFLGPLDVLVLSAIYGRAGAYGGSESFGLPGFEIVLASSCVGAAFWIASRPSILRSSRFHGALIWVPAAAWGFALVLTSRQSDLVSRVREAMVFVYPALFAFPLLTLDLRRTRQVERIVPYLFVGLGWVVLLAGTYNLITDVAILTNTGQSRYLAGSFAVPLVGAFFAAVGQYRTGQWRLRGLIIGAFPVGGLLLVNHRSAFLGLAFSVLVFSASQVLRARRRTKPLRRRDARLITALAALIGLFLLTPVGQAGIDRAVSVFDTSDANIALRLVNTQEVLSADVHTLIVGVGVGLERTPAFESFDPAVVFPRTEAHNSFATMIRRGGLFGLLLVGVPISSALRKMWQVPRGVVGSLLGIAVFGLTMAASNVVLENSYFGVWVWVPLILGAMLADRSPPLPGISEKL